MIVNNTEEENVEWRSCCMKVDKNMVKYISQVGI